MVDRYNLHRARRAKTPIFQHERHVSAVPYCAERYANPTSAGSRLVAHFQKLRGGLLEEVTVRSTNLKWTSRTYFCVTPAIAKRSHRFDCKVILLPRQALILLIVNSAFSLHRTKAAVRELDNLNYRKMKKILMVDNCETESNVGDAEDTPDDQVGGDSSKSNSITSEHSMQSIGGIVPSSQNSSSSSIQPSADQQAMLHRNSSRHRPPPAIPPHHQQPQYVNASPGMVYGNHHHHERYLFTSISMLTQLT